MKQHDLAADTRFEQRNPVFLDAEMNEAISRVSGRFVCRSMFVNSLPRNIGVPVDDQELFHSFLLRLLEASMGLAGEGDVIRISASLYPMLVDLRLDIPTRIEAPWRMPGVFTREECKNASVLFGKLRDSWQAFRIAAAMGAAMRLRCFFTPGSPGGITLHCLLPLLKQQRAEDGDQLKVLIVEDTAPILTLYRFALSATDCIVLSARDGAEGLALARRYLPHVVTTSIMMPNRDGFDLLFELQRDPATVRIPVLMVSVLHDFHSSFSLGAADHLVKPLAAEEYRAAVQRFAALGRTPAQPLLPMLHRVAILSPEPHGGSLTGRLWRGIDVVCIDTGRLDALESFLGMDKRYSLVVFDCRENVRAMLPYASLPLLHPSVRDVRSVAVSSAHNDVEARLLLDGLVSLVYERDAFTLDAIRSDLRFR